MSGLEKMGVITKSELDLSEMNFFSIVFGSGTGLVRATPDFFFTYLLIKNLQKLFNIFPSLEELIWEYLFFLMLRPRVMIPISLVLVFNHMEVHTLGLNGYQLVTKSTPWSWRPDVLAIIGFTGLWISVENEVKSADTWLFGTALFVA